MIDGEIVTSSTVFGLSEMLSRYSLDLREVGMSDGVKMSGLGVVSIF